MLGVDIGGTKTRAIAVRVTGEQLADVDVGSASFQAGGEPVVIAALDRLVAALGAGVVADVRTVVVGSAGIDTTELVERLTALVRARFPGADVDVVHDTRLLLAAAQVDAGCVLIVGTGSAAYALAPDGRDARAGGWGWLLGDEGSGYGLVREAIRRALSDLDHGRPESDLTVRLLAAVGVQQPVDLIGAVYDGPGAGVWARYTPVVMDAVRAGCPSARSVLDVVLDAAAGEVVTASTRVAVDGPVVLAGGFVTNVEEASVGVRDRLERAGFRDIRVLRRDPVHGAVDLALARVGDA